MCGCVCVGVCGFCVCVCIGLSVGVCVGCVWGCVRVCVCHNRHCKICRHFKALFLCSIKNYLSKENFL